MLSVSVLRSIGHPLGVVCCGTAPPAVLARSLGDGGTICLPGVTGSEQVVEQRSEVDHRLTQLLGAGLSVASSDRDLVGRSIVLDHRRMLHGYVGRPLLEVLFDRIAAVVHHSLHELMGLANGTHRLIHEVALSRRPLLQIALAGGGIERPDLELADSLTAIGQLLLGGALVAPLRHDAAVLRPKLILQSPRPLLTCNENSDDHQQNDDNRQQHPDHGSTLLLVLPGPIDDLQVELPRSPGVNRPASQPRRMHADIAPTTSVSRNPAYALPSFETGPPSRGL